MLTATTSSAVFPLLCITVAAFTVPVASSETRTVVVPFVAAPRAAGAMSGGGGVCATDAGPSLVAQFGVGDGFAAVGAAASVVRALPPLEGFDPPDPGEPPGRGFGTAVDRGEACGDGLTAGVGVGGDGVGRRVTRNACTC